MSTGENLRLYLIGSTAGSTAVKAAVASRVYQNSVPTIGTLPFVWFRRRGVEFLETCGEVNQIPYIERYDFEIVAETLDQADDTADIVRSRLHGARGTLNSTTSYQWVEVQDQREDYVPRNIQADELLHIVSLDVEVINQ